MFDHIGLRTKRFKVLDTFYARVLPALGIERLAKYPDGAGYGRDARGSRRSLFLRDAA